MEELKEKLTHVAKDIQEGYDKVYEKIKEQVEKDPNQLLGELKEQLKLAGKNIEAGSAKIYEKIKEQIENAPTLEEAKQIIATEAAKFQGELKKFGDKLKEAYKSIVNKQQ